MATLPNVGFLGEFYSGILALIAIKIAVFIIFGLYRITYKFAQINEFLNMVLAIVFAETAAVTAAVMGQMSFALGYRLLGLALLFDVLLIVISRLVYIVFLHSRSEEPTRLRSHPREAKKSIMVIGTDRYAAQLIDEISENDGSGARVDLVIDDEEENVGKEILGVKIAGGIKDIRLLARRQNIDEIIIARPTANRRRTAQLLRECIKTRSKILMLPPQKKKDMSLDIEYETGDLVSPNIYDFLGSDRLKVDHTEINSFLRGQVVLITGGGGVVGSELAKQILKYKPRRLVALDSDENGLTELVCKLENKIDRETTEFVPIVASVRDEAYIRGVFEAYKPHIVFHAAELKAVHITQDHPREAFLTNVIGTKTVAMLASEFSVDDFILLSSGRAGYAKDSASIMKRASERLVLELGKTSRTGFSVVRFSNVIESRGNVLRIFENQIAQGGPVTVTDKDVYRRFVSAETAAMLTLRAASLDGSGDVMSLEVGTEISILELAEAMVRLHGAVPYEDVDIVITELRSGEKLLENAVGAGESLSATIVSRISTVNCGEAEVLGSVIEGLPTDVRNIGDAEVRSWIGRL
ncbi:MAG: polysaccharide biosynthesis protein [Clostridiales Family XIII bacterium]|nr:polysaccharide biosynthesis protein [Clostridiales Family XIII bacterium]